MPKINQNGLNENLHIFVKALLGLFRTHLCLDGVDDDEIYKGKKRRSK